MQLNYFGSLRVTMGVLPGMVTKKKGHVVNISSIGVLTNAPRFSAYVASKAALDALCVKRVCRSRNLVHHYQHAAGAHAHDCPCLHFQASAHYHASGYHRATVARRAAAYCANRHEHQLSPEAIAMQQMMRGIHF